MQVCTESVEVLNSSQYSVVREYFCSEVFLIRRKHFGPFSTEVGSLEACGVSEHPRHTPSFHFKVLPALSELFSLECKLYSDYSYLTRATWHESSPSMFYQFIYGVAAVLHQQVA